MKNKTLLYILLAGGLYYVLYKRFKDSRQAKVNVQRPYTLDVSEAEVITEEQFKKPSILEKITPIAKKVLTKAKEKRAARKKVGYFPDIY
jgi:hypothetical protein